ncbi:hypothetical protein ONZ45_g7670 [Pleurotus djamor]|nr:hypothetical protein ONZ45_g7670 [Pleurotus djamor]
MTDPTVNVPMDPTTLNLYQYRSTATSSIEGSLKDGMETGHFPPVSRTHTPEIARPPFQLYETLINGYLSIHLPSSFQGRLTIHVGAGDPERHIKISSKFARSLRCAARDERLG